MFLELRTAYKKYGILILIAKIIKSLGIRLETKIKKNLYSKNKNNYQINVDDDNFSMTFLNYEIGGTIQQRIDGVREPETTTLIKSLLRPGDMVLELGGCYGYFTMLMANAVSASGKVVSIEGLPNNFEILETNIKLNSYKNIECYNFFIANGKKTIEFDFNDTNPYKGIKRFRSNDHTFNKNDVISIECINIPDFLEKINFHPTHIFMDIEGFEVDALEQLSNDYLDNHSPTIVFEYHDQYYANGKDTEYLIKLLNSKNYTTKKIYGNILAFKNYQP